MHTGLVTDDLIKDDDTLEPIIEIFEGSTYENRHNLDSDFIKGLESTYKGQMRERYLMGKWAAYEGLVYPDFSRETHMIPKDDMLEMLEYASDNRSLYQNVEFFDFGLVNPSCYCIGFSDYRGRVFIVDGFHKPLMPIDDIGTEILRLRSEYDYGINFDNPIWADPAIFRRTVVDGSGKGASTVKKLLSTRFDLVFKAGQNDVASGIAKVADYLIPRRGMHYNPGKPEGPMVYFSDHLSFIEDEMVAYFWKANPQGDRLDEPRDGNDHFCDGLKYGLSYLPAASTLHFKPPILTPEYMKWQEARD
jgi:hypothetical protein